MPCHATQCIFYLFIIYMSAYFICIFQYVRFCVCASKCTQQRKIVWLFGQRGECVLLRLIRHSQHASTPLFFFASAHSYCNSGNSHFYILYANSAHDNFNFNLLLVLFLVIFIAPHRGLDWWKMPSTKFLRSTSKVSTDL